MKEIEVLTSVIQREAEVAEALEKIMKKKQQAFIHWKSDELEKAVKDEEALVTQLHELEKERTSLQKTIVSAVASEENIVTVSDLLKRYPSNELKAVSDRLKRASAKILRRNKQNRQLLQNSLSFVQHTLAVLTNNYQRSLVDQKI